MLIIAPISIKFAITEFVGYILGSGAKLTTTVHDKNAKLITSDSRWSCNLSNSEILYIDSSEFEKMVEVDQFALVMAGDAILISHWKNWAKGDITRQIPNVVRNDALGNEHHISICMIFKPSTVLFDVDVATIVTPHARFSGSGRSVAMDCWEDNKCAKKAVDSAIDADIYSGGSVKYVELSTQDNNLSADTATVDELHRLMQNEGYVMNTKTNEIVEIKDYNNRDDVVKGMENGKLVASAPTGSDESPWNESQKSALENAVDVLRTLVSK